MSDSSEILIGNYEFMYLSAAPNGSAFSVATPATRLEDLEMEGGATIMPSAHRSSSAHLFDPLPRLYGCVNIALF